MIKMIIIKKILKAYHLLQTWISKLLEKDKLFLRFGNPMKFGENYYEELYIEILPLKWIEIGESTTLTPEWKKDYESLTTSPPYIDWLPLVSFIFSQKVWEDSISKNTAQLSSKHDLQNLILYYQKNYLESAHIAFDIAESIKNTIYEITWCQIRELWDQNIKIRIVNWKLTATITDLSIDIYWLIEDNTELILSLKRHELIQTLNEPSPLNW